MRRKSVLWLSLAALVGSGCIGQDQEHGGAAALPDGVSQELVDAARANLERVSREIDINHLNNYGLSGSTADQFVQAVILEYREHPELLQRRLQTLASMVFFSAPEVGTDASLGRVTPFHGMDDDAFEALMANEDFVFEHHMDVNDGSPNGVRPFSVCETRFLIAISKGDAQADPQHAFTSGDRITNYDGYAHAFAAYAGASCEQADLDEWYNFRGLGGLRPSWLESNISDRFLRRMASSCDSPPDYLEADCEAWNADRLGYRDRKNTELALREFFYDPRPETTIAGTGMSFEEYMLDPDNSGVLVEDRNGDGIGEWIASGTLRALPGARIRFSSGSSLSSPTDVRVRLKSDAQFSTDSGNVNLPAGTELVAPANTGLQLTRTTYRDADSNEPVQLNANWDIGIPSWTTLRNGDTEVTWRGNSALTVALAQPLSIPVAPDAPAELSVDSGNSQFSGNLNVNVPLAGGGSMTGTINVGDVQAYDAIDPAWNRSMLDTPDLGLRAVFPDEAGCTGSTANPDTCGLVRRFYSLIDRHENFYQTYSGLRPDSYRVSQQPSPLVACSITLEASHGWDSAGTPDGGNAGFIYLMRIPFRHIFAGDTRSISTLGLLSNEGNPLEAGPRVTTVSEVYEHGVEIDMSRLWFDIATLSHNEYESEHEVSKFGSVPAEQIEGILVIRRPAAMGGSDDSDSDYDSDSE